MIERWRLETHMFHLPIGETTITLQDVEVLFGLPVDGLPIAYPYALREYTRLHYLEMLQRLTGFQPAEETTLSGASRLQLTPVRQHLEVMDANITDDSSDLLIHWYTILLMLYMFGGVLFPNNSENLVSLRFLHHLERLDDLPGYSWGATVLGYLYRQMCRASMGTQRDIAGLLPLLQVWAWERFLQSQPPLPPIVPDAPPPPFLPLARRRVDRRGYGCEVEARHHLPYYRDLLDLLEGAQFIWRPYSDELIAGLPDYCSIGRVMWSTSVLLMRLDIAEHQATKQVLRQFGRLQLVPTLTAWLRTHYQQDDRSRVDQTYVAWLEA
ncbi:PREDICTED: serine/threonine-protein phosphatase 7 long form homolog [Nicotiana attenuata]|uniref:serine/threonine-protein phosphatase 7 long form homolog n=1 Tax=Nicotiana attenuata TaxID=49451 RepID=UPI0009052D9F|nr:PREDICTED: serine/threonine-protein phosphatase 7 long form homolog [Nicotiana attenuata]